MKQSKELREILDVIDAALVKEDNTALQLWDVLTALRGPDNDALPFSFKKAGTAPIRRAAFPRSAVKADSGNLGFIGNADFTAHNYISPTTNDSDVDYDNEHIIGHIRRGAVALGLADAV